MISMTVNNLFLGISSMCVWVCVSLLLQPYLSNLELSSFGMSFLVWKSNNSVLKFLKNCFCAVIALFLYFFKITM